MGVGVGVNVGEDDADVVVEEEEEEDAAVTLKDREVTSPNALAPMSLALSDSADTGDSNGAVDDDICDACVG